MKPITLIVIVVLGLSCSEAVLFKLTTPEIIKADGYPVESHEVTTSDGYQLTMFRIPYSPKLNNKNTRKRVAFLMHGFISSSDCWILSGPNNSLAYILSDSGYDVWLGNARGNTYSNKNSKILGGALNPLFWRFSWHEIAIIDLPTMFDYIFKTTKESDLHYVGHSQGTTVYFVLLAYYPEYNKIIKTGHMLAPVAYMTNIQSPFAFLAPVISIAPTISNFMGNLGFLPSTELMAMFGATACKAKGLHLDTICANAIFMLTGFDHEHLDYSLLPKLTATHPAGSSTGQLLHFAQNYKVKGFRQYDFGITTNFIKYRSMAPPAYNASNISARTYLYYGDNDFMSHPTDVKRLASEIGSICELYHVPIPKWNHLNYLCATNVKNLINIPVRDRMLAFDSGKTVKNCKKFKGL